MVNGGPEQTLKREEIMFSNNSNMGLIKKKNSVMFASKTPLNTNKYNKKYTKGTILPSLPSIET